MNKKTLSIILVVILAAVAWFAFDLLAGPETSTGAKEVTLEIYAEKEGIDVTYTVRTDAEVLQTLLEEQGETIQVVIEDSSYGPVLMGLEGYVSDFTADYWGIVINGEYGMLGIAEQPVTDGDVIRFELTDL